MIQIAIHFWYGAFVDGDKSDLKIFELLEFYYSNWAMTLFAHEYLNQPQP